MIYSKEKYVISVPYSINSVINQYHVSELQ